MFYQRFERRRTVVFIFGVCSNTNHLQAPYYYFFFFCFYLFPQVFNKRTFTKNYLVQNLVAKLDDLECLGSSPNPSKPVKADGRCGQHGEELKLYCQTDKRPICVVCRESRAHRWVETKNRITNICLRSLF